MTRDDLYGYIQAPDSLGTSTLEPLRTLVEAYPYCATFVYLYLYNLALVKDLRYATELRRLALLLPDRERLYQVVECHAILEVGASNTSVSAQTEDSFALIESFLSEVKAQGEDLPQELNWSIGIDRDDYFATVRGTPSSERSPQANLVLEAMGQTPKEVDATTTDPQESLDLEEALFTETLAKIYIRQGRYDKALRIIHSISLNYPKKNRFFAQQIRFLERLILNK